MLAVCLSENNWPPVQQPISIKHSTAPYYKIDSGLDNVHPAGYPKINLRSGLDTMKRGLYHPEGVYFVITTGWMYIIQYSLIHHNRTRR